jgi:hypothetical protein
MTTTQSLDAKLQFHVVAAQAVDFLLHQAVTSFVTLLLDVGQHLGEAVGVARLAVGDGLEVEGRRQTVDAALGGELCGDAVIARDSPQAGMAVVIVIVAGDDSLTGWSYGGIGHGFFFLRHRGLNGW